MGLITHLYSLLNASDLYGDNSYIERKKEVGPVEETWFTLDESLLDGNDRLKA